MFTWNLTSHLLFDFITFLYLVTSLLNRIRLNSLATMHPQFFILCSHALQSSKTLKISVPLLLPPVQHRLHVPRSYDIMAASSSTVPVMISYVGIAVASASVVNVVPPVSTLRLVSTPATFNSYVFLDLETTGIITTEDPICRITELSMWGIEREQFLNCNGSKMPRITNRLNMCVDPSKEIHPMAATKSKLDNLNLSHQSPFDEDVANTVLSFLNRLKKPMCMIAHYGFKFDFPVLKSEIANVGKDFSEDVFCADSLPVFRTCQRLAPGVPYSYTLENVYKRIYNNQPEVMHEAEDDVKMLLWSAAATPRPFLNAVANTAVPIATINKCW